MDKGSTIRLVIRAKILPAEQPQTPVSSHWRRRALPLIGAAIAVLVLGGIAVRVFRTDPPSPPARSAAETATAAARPVKAASTEEKSADARSPEPPAAQSEVRGEPDAPPSPVNEVIPDVPRSALETIRGTIRVSVRVIVDKEGAVLAATTEEPGPSRYFERQALEASKKWTFEPEEAEEQRRMLVRFNFTRAGVTAGASPLQ